MNKQDINPKNWKPTKSEQGDSTVTVSAVQKFADIMPVLEGHGLVDNLVHDDITVQEIWLQISEKEYMFQIAQSGEFGGFFTLDDRGVIAGCRTLEIHAFILPYMRRYSKEFLKYFAQFIFEMTDFDCIMTSVPEHCYKVGRLLKFIGFKEIGFIPEQYKLKGEDKGVTYYILTKTEK